MGKEGDEFYLDIKDPDIVTLDRKKAELTALKEGETTVRYMLVPHRTSKFAVIFIHLIIKLKTGGLTSTSIVLDFYQE